MDDAPLPFVVRPKQRAASISKPHAVQAFQLEPSIFLNQRDGAVDFLLIAQDKTARD
jgi:hypothetical protein